jgi:hypothetical protein
MLKSSHSFMPTTLLLCLIGLLSAADVRGEESSVVQSDPYAARKVFYEQHWQWKIEGALKFVDGVVVRVNVDLKPETGRTVTTKEYLPRPMIETEVQSEQKHHTQVASSEDSKNASAQHAFPDDAVKSESYVKNIFSENQVETRTAGLVPNYVSVSVSVPKSYYAAVWAQSHQPASSDDMTLEVKQATLHNIENGICAKIESTVRALLPRESSQDMVCVTSFDDIADAKVQSSGQAKQQAIRQHDVVTVTFEPHDLAGATAFFDRQSTSDTSDDATVRIPVAVVDVCPNGNLVVESQRTTKIDDVTKWRKLTGVIRPDSIDPESRSVSASQVADLRLESRITLTNAATSLK